MRNTKSSLSRVDAGGDQKQDYHLEWPKHITYLGLPVAYGHQAKVRDKLKALNEERKGINT